MLGVGKRRREDVPGQVGGGVELGGQHLRGDSGERQEIRKSSFYKSQN